MWDSTAVKPLGFIQTSLTFSKLGFILLHKMEALPPTVNVSDEGEMVGGTRAR